LDFVRAYRANLPSLVVLAVLSLVGALLESAGIVLLVPLGQAVVADETSYDGSLGPFSLNVSVEALALVAAVCIVASGLLQVAASEMRARIVSKWERQQKDAVYREFLAASYPVQVTSGAGRLHELISNNVTRGAVALGQLAAGVKSLLNLIVLLITALVVDFRAAIGIVTLGVLLFLGLRPVSRRVRAAGKRVAAVGMQVAEETHEGTTHSRDIRVFDVAGPLADRMLAILRHQERLRLRSLRYSGAIPTLYNSLGLLMLVGILAVAGGIDDLNVSELGAVTLLVLRGLSYGQQFQAAYQGANESRGYVEQLTEARQFLRASSEVFGGGGIDQPASLRVEHVTYRYPGAPAEAPPALDDVCIDFHHGEIIGLVGRSGSGKTTLAQIVLRLRAPTEGKVFLGDQDIRDFSEASWHRHVSLVPQQVQLLHETVRENIRFFRDDVTEEHIVGAAELAGIHDAIMALPEGYDTKIGPAVRDLSGGQIQRIGIARAVAGRPSVLVLDEPTSALDMHAEQIVQEALHRLRGFVLMIVIAHRLSTLEICDRLMVMQSGSIVVVGDRDDVRRNHVFFQDSLEALDDDLENA
jgi:ATP-binding cassette, subfamily B, bacterial